ncbi:hypothetical protein DFH94DRAFT_695107 [Russula ochroleuca]|uniref:Uncharacterized protein n=1 Tax=Russula ochroleuca TaxID=152965 RepID=A0A9P5MRZ0_9AGAM|nr:hypothetical protein DFH94DRAFT_695107 [Russula ochroleuca]
MLELIKKAAEGTYHPKGFDEEDDLQALLFLHLGGAHVVDIAHHIFGTPSVSTIRTCTSIPQILASPSFPTQYEIEHNIAATFEGLLELLGQKSHHAVIMFDEISIENLEFTSEDDLQTLWEDSLGLQSATVGAIAVLSPQLRLYSTCPILISGSCKRETAEDHALLLQAVVNAINSKKDMTGLRIISLASDGESRQGKALSRLTYIAPLAPSSPIYNQLIHLPLFDTFVGADDITADKDYKHIFKQLRNALLRDKGCVVHGIKLMHGLICKHLQDSGLSNIHINHVLDSTDKQDIVLAYNLLKDLWCLPAADPERSTQCYEHTASTRAIRCIRGS